MLKLVDQEGRDILHDILMKSSENPRYVHRVKITQPQDMRKSRWNPEVGYTEFYVIRLVPEWAFSRKPSWNPEVGDTEFYVIWEAG